MSVSCVPKDLTDGTGMGWWVQVGNFIHYLATFLAGLVVGFVSAWRLALLSIAVIPGIAFAGGLYAYTLTGLTSKSRDSYANAGIIAEQVAIIPPFPND